MRYSVLLLAAGSGIGSTKIDLCSKVKQTILLLRVVRKAAV